MSENLLPPLDLSDPIGTDELVLPELPEPPLPPPLSEPTPPIAPAETSIIHSTATSAPTPDASPSPLPSEIPVVPVQTPSVTVRKFPFILAVVLIFLSVVAAIGIYLLVQVRTMALDKITPSPVPIPSPTPTPDPTADWQSYHNSKYSYSLKVPNFLSHLNRGPSNQKKIDDNDWYFAKTDTSQLDSLHKSIASSGAIFLEIAVYKDAAKQNYDLHCMGTPLSFNQQDPVITTEPLVSEVEGFVQSTGLAFHSTVPKAEYWDSKVCFIKDDIDYEIYYQNYENSEPDNTLAQILSTFKFAPVEETTDNQYVCPKTEWVDCMPSPDAGVKLECTPDYLTWARANCPRFKGGAL